MHNGFVVFPPLFWRANRCKIENPATETRRRLRRFFGGAIE